MALGLEYLRCARSAAWWLPALICLITALAVSAVRPFALLQERASLVAQLEEPRSSDDEVPSEKGRMEPQSPNWILFSSADVPEPLRPELDLVDWNKVDRLRRGHLQRIDRPPRLTA